MSNTPRLPLLSDEDINDPKLVIPLGAKMIRDIYEAARAKDAELIQRLVDALNRLVYFERCNAEGLSSGAPTSMDWQQAFDKAQQQIDVAAAAGFTPTHP